MASSDEFYDAKAHRLEGDAEVYKARIAHVGDTQIQERRDHECHLAEANRKTRAAERKLETEKIAHAELLKKDDELRRLKAANNNELRKMRETITMTKEENSQLTAELVRAETEAKMHHRQTAENTETLCLELAHFCQTIENKESRDWRKTQEELAMIKAEDMQLRANLANAQDMTAARQ